MAKEGDLVVNALIVEVLSPNGYLSPGSQSAGVVAEVRRDETIVIETVQHTFYRCLGNALVVSDTSPDLNDETCALIRKHRARNPKD